MEWSLLLAELQRRMPYKFKDEQLLVRAMTDESFSKDHNQRLEFLGDSILNTIVTVELFNHYQTREGDLTRKRSEIICNDNLTRVARDSLELDRYIRYGSGSRAKLADYFEALIGAIHQDGGQEDAKRIVLNYLWQPEMRQMSCYPMDFPSTVTNNKFTFGPSNFSFAVQAPAAGDTFFGQRRVQNENQNTRYQGNPFAFRQNRPPHLPNAKKNRFQNDRNTNTQSSIVNDNRIHDHSAKRLLQDHFKESDQSLSSLKVTHVFCASKQSGKRHTVQLTIPGLPMMVAHAHNRAQAELRAARKLCNKGLRRDTQRNNDTDMRTRPGFYGANKQNRPPYRPTTRIYPTPAPVLPAATDSKGETTSPSSSSVTASETPASPSLSSVKSEPDTPPKIRDEVDKVISTSFELITID